MKSTKKDNQKNDDLLQHLLHGNMAINTGPNAKEMFLQQVDAEYNNGNWLPSIFYQVRALYQASQERYYQINKTLLGSEAKDATTDVRNLEVQLNDWERENLKSNPLLQYALKTLKDAANGAAANTETQYSSCNFLRNITNPMEGIKKIETICQQMPKEWTILQLCKAPRAETTYSIFPQIHEYDAAIYVTLLRHARSAAYPTPICLRFSGPEQPEVYKKFANMANYLKQCINVDPKDYNTKQAKKMYWELLDELDQHIAQALQELKNFFFPWNFLFSGTPCVAESCTSPTLPAQQPSHVFASVDDFCNEYKWEPNERVLLSLAALHIHALSELEVHAICAVLTSSEQQQVAAAKLLLKLQNAANSCAPSAPTRHFPCILIVDERLDHFFWEELNVQQEFCRVNSLQCLWRLYRLYEPRIHNGYLRVNITDGGCLVNPDNNLPKTELRMRSFFEYWTPHWLKKFAEKPTQDELLKDFFKRPCYVYAGHGSGLQYINGKHIARQQMNCVVFLFGCDSSRLHSNGLYSELVGSHLYYHAAMCPTLVGTLMPGLDANMDGVATEILSRWIAPRSTNVLPWQEIERISWVKEGLIKPKCKIGEQPPTIANTPDYQMGSLCAILARIHRRLTDAKYYNTVPYVCRGLPVWNCDVQPLPQ